jgi:hypothetical protein
VRRRTKPLRKRAISTCGDGFGRLSRAGAHLFGAPAGASSCHSGRGFGRSGREDRPMRRKLAVYSMFALFACAYATLDRVPRAAAQVLRGGSEHVMRSEGPEVSISPEA